MTVYGPYISQKDGRRYVKLYSNNKVKTISYARYLMQKHLGRELKPNEQVHHKDENKLNDCIENFEIKLLGIHQSEHKKYSDRIIECPVCHIKFKLTAIQQRTRAGNKSKQPPCCSKECAGKYYATNRKTQIL